MKKTLIAAASLLAMASVAVAEEASFKCFMVDAEGHVAMETPTMVNDAEACATAGGLDEAAAMKKVEESKH